MRFCFGGFQKNADFPNEPPEWAQFDPNDPGATAGGGGISGGAGGAGKAGDGKSGDAAKKGGPATLTKAKVTAKNLKKGGAGMRGKNVMDAARVSAKDKRAMR